jgi:uncharacterized membrane protein
MNRSYGTTRRGIAALSAVGAANMALGAMRQFGVIRHLPDPPIRGFDSNAVMMSRPAFAFGVPDTPIAAFGLLANIPLAIVGGRLRVRNRPWLPIAIAAKAVAEVAVAGWYLVQMRMSVHTWCAYCLMGASISASIAVLACREAASTLHSTGARVGGVTAALVIAGGAFAFMTALDRWQQGRHKRRLSRSARRLHVA